MIVDEKLVLHMVDDEQLALHKFVAVEENGVEVCELATKASSIFSSGVRSVKFCSLVEANVFGVAGTSTVPN
nr:hypothetical protein [Tanacetum cinerariifolium]